MANEGFHKIGDVANLLATSVRTIRYYEEEGLLTPIRTEGGTRLYSFRHIERIKGILNLTRIGYPIEAINTLAHIREKHRTGDKSQTAVSLQLDEWLEDLSSQIEALSQLANDIKKTKRAIHRCAGCKNPPTSKGCPNCPIKERLDDIELLNIIWDESG